MAATATKPPPVIDSHRLGRKAGEHLKRQHPDWSVDELLLHPTEALEICRLTNLSLSIRRHPDEVLRALLNARKRGELRDGK